GRPGVSRRSQFEPYPSDQEVLAVAFITDVSARKHAETALLKSHEKLRLLTGRLMSVRDEESKRISRELHDVFSQEPAALSTQTILLNRFETGKRNKGPRAGTVEGRLCGQGEGRQCSYLLKVATALML